MKNVRFALILMVLAIAASACSGSGGNPVTGPSPSGFTLTRLVIGLADQGTDPTGVPIPNGATVNAGTRLKYNAYYTGPDGEVTIVYKTFRNGELVDTITATGPSFNLGEVGRARNYTPMVSGSYEVKVSIESAPNTVNATYEAR